jgi:hypothetical protein
LQQDSLITNIGQYNPEAYPLRVTPMTYEEILGTIPGNENDKDLKYFHDKSKCFAGYLTIGLFLAIILAIT